MQLGQQFIDGKFDQSLPAFFFRQYSAGTPEAARYRRLDEYSFSTLSATSNS